MIGMWVSAWVSAWVSKSLRERERDIVRETESVIDLIYIEP